MTDRPDGGHGEPPPGQRPDDSTWAAPPRDDQWTSVDGPQGPGYPYQPGRPNPQHPPTRAFDPGDGGYPPTGYEQNPYPQGGYGQNQYPPSQYGYQQPYDQGGQGGQYPPTGYPPNQYPPEQFPGDGTAAAPPPGGSSRTLWLIAAVVALLVVIVLVAGYFLVSNSDGDDVATPASTSTVETTVDPAPTEESTPPTSGIPGAQPSASAAPGQILYSLSGNGQILGLTYAAGSSIKISPRPITPPWAVATDVTGTASLTAVVLQGQVTRTITLDGRVLDTSTSSTGLLRCEAPAG